MKKSIPTEYNGVNFRSRLEATVAAFFDKEGIKWKYEPQSFLLPYMEYTSTGDDLPLGFNRDGTAYNKSRDFDFDRKYVGGERKIVFNAEHYWPDFYLPDSRIWVEVKPVEDDFTTDKHWHFQEFLKHRLITNDLKNGKQTPQSLELLSENYLLIAPHAVDFFYYGELCDIDCKALKLSNTGWNHFKNYRSTCSRISKEVRLRGDDYTKIEIRTCPHCKRVTINSEFLPCRTCLYFGMDFKTSYLFINWIKFQNEVYNKV